MSKDSDIAILGNGMRQHRSLRRQRYGVPCPECPKNRHPTILVPQQQCKVDGYIDPRPRLTQEQEDELWKECGFTKVHR